MLLGKALGLSFLFPNFLCSPTYSALPVLLFLAARRMFSCPLILRLPVLAGRTACVPPGTRVVSGIYFFFIWIGGIFCLGSSCVRWRITNQCLVVRGLGGLRISPMANRHSCKAGSAGSGILTTTRSEPSSTSSSKTMPSRIETRPVPVSSSG